MPTMAAAFVYELLEVRDHLAPERALEIAIGFVMAFLAALVVVKPFLRYVRAIGLRAVCVVPDRGRAWRSSRRLERGWL